MKQFSRFILVPFLALLAACGTAEKYPYPPQFVAPQEISMRVLPTPPAKFSAQYNAEIKSILARQAKLNDAQKANLHAEDHIRPEMIVLPVLGPHYTEENYPALYSLLRHAASDAWRIGDSAQDYWKSPRPWVADARVKLLVPSISRPGYPSGHTTTNSVWAHVLSELFPEKREALFARAVEIGQHRIDGGAHFPHDIEGGKRMARVIYAKMHANAQYQAELNTVAEELRSAPRPRIDAVECLQADPNLEQAAVCQ